MAEKKSLISRVMSLFDIKLWKFLLVGVINTLVGLGIENGVFYFLWHSEWGASAINYVLTSILSYFLNKYFTFKSRGNSWKEVVRFAVNIAVCYVLSHGIAIPVMTWLLRDVNAPWTGTVVMLTGMCLFVGFNYLGQRFFAFRAPQEPESSDEQPL